MYLLFYWWSGIIAYESFVSNILPCSVERQETELASMRSNRRRLPADLEGAPRWHGVPWCPATNARNREPTMVGKNTSLFCFVFWWSLMELVNVNQHQSKKQPRSTFYFYFGFLCSAFCLKSLIIAVERVIFFFLLLVFCTSEVSCAFFFFFLQMGWVCEKSAQNVQSCKRAMCTMKGSSLSPPFAVILHSLFQ